MTHILHRSANAKMPVAVGGKGIELFDRNGKSYIDASGGAAVSCLGHGHPDVIAALHEQLDRLAYAHTGFFTTEVAEQLADRLIETAPKGIDHVYLVSGGSEAIEAALKMARQYFVEKGEPQRRHIIARRQSYHGNTLGALATGGNEWRRAQFRPLKATLSGRGEKMLMKLIVDAASRKVIGAHILGHDAGEMAQILGITLKAGCTKDDFDRTMAVHPTAAEELVTMYAPSYRIVDGQKV